MLQSRRIILFALDILFLGFSYAVFFIVSGFSSVISVDADIKKYVLNFLLFLVCIFSFRLIFRIYANVWRYANTRAYLYIVISDFCGALFAFLLSRFLFISSYISVWNCFVNVALFSLITLMSRFVYQYSANIKFYPKSSKGKINVAIVGAGKTGSLLAEELLYNSNSNYRPLCFIDINKERVGKYICGIKIIEENEHVFENIRKLTIDEIFVALPSLSSKEARDIYDLYSKTGCKIKLYDFAMGNENKDVQGKRSLREFGIEDLLFREALNINNNKTFDYYKDKTVLVTGGGGSIGSEICRQIAKAKPKKLIVFDIYENNVYDIQQEFSFNYGADLNFCAEIGSVRDIARLESVFEEYHPDIVFHAAAHKHVPLMENSCCEAVKNNVFGTLNTVNCAEKYGIEKFIMISTDKAVNPTNVMGASKRLCEMIVQSRFDSEKTEFAAVRFGNVLGSNGSVIPLFKRQIEKGGPITLTDKRIIRYFMTIPEASQLVLQAGAVAKDGELFVLDMGKPIRIIDLAENLIKLSGLKPYDDIDIVETGLRPGEKLYEELLIKSEDLTKTDNDLIFIEKDKPFSRLEIDEMLNKLSKVINGSNTEVKNVMKSIVSTYVDPEMINTCADGSDEMKQIYKAPNVSEVDTVIS